MTRRSPRAAGSSQERPRLAGKEPGSYRAATMFVHFRETPYGLAMSLVEKRRENGKVRHEHVVSLGSIETPPSVAARIEFWRELHDRLAELSNRLDAETRSWWRCTLGSQWSRRRSNAHHRSPGHVH
jgi:hypothetical protein